MGAHQSIVPSQMFQTSDSWLMVMAQQDKFFYALADGLEMPELAKDERFTSIENRYENRDILLHLLTERFKMRSTGEWIALLEGKVPVAPVNSLPQALKDPQVEALDLIIEYEHSTLGRIRQTGPPFKFSDYDPDFKPASPIGADTEVVLQELGNLTSDEIDELRNSKTIQ